VGNQKTEKCVNETIPEVIEMLKDRYEFCFGTKFKYFRMNDVVVAAIPNVIKKFKNRNRATS
jgi:uncharacterized membrane protein